MFRLFFILTIFLATGAFSQIVMQKQLTGKWNSNLFYSNCKIADTIYLTKSGTEKNIYLTSKNKAKAKAFYMYCGKTTFKDYFLPKPPKWITEGSWSIKTINEKIVLTVTNNNQAYILTLLSGNKTEYRFIVKEMWVLNKSK